MRQLVGTVLLIGICSGPMIASQARGGAAAGSRISACSLLTRELVMKVGTVEGKRVLDLVRPTEDQLGANGSGCDYGGIGLQINPFARADELRQSPGKDWTRVSGVGDKAFFRDNGGRWAELMVWTGPNHFTIQMGVPTRSSAEAIKPNTIALANELIPKLR